MGHSTGRASITKVLDFAWSAGEFTASEAMCATSLARSTVTGAIYTLVGARILRELPDAREVGGLYRSGRPAHRFAVSPELGLIAGIDISVASLGIRVADNLGRTLVDRRTELDPTRTSDARLVTIVRRLRAAVDETDVPRRDVLALCVALPAPAERDDAGTRRRQRTLGTNDFRLEEAICECAAVVEIKRPAQLAAIAEGVAGAASGCRDYIALLVSAGVSAGVVVDGRVLNGAHGGIGGRELFDRFLSVGQTTGTRRRPEEQDDAAVFWTGVPPYESEINQMVVPRTVGRESVPALVPGDEDPVRAIREAGARLARIVGLLGRTYDLTRVVVCGANVEKVHPVLEAARRLLSDMQYRSPQIFASALGAEVVLAGAVVIAQRTAREHGIPLLLR